MSAETPTTPVTQAAAAVAATPPATPPPATPAQPQTVTIPLEQLQTFTSVQARLAQMEADQRSRDEAARAEQVKLLAQKGEIENALRIQREEAQKQLDGERAQPRRRRGAGETVRPRRRGLARPRVAAARPGRRRAAHPALAESVRRRAAGRLVHRPHADVPVGRRLRRGPARPPRVCPLYPCIEPRRRHGRDHRRPPGRPDVAREPGRADAAQELRRGDHPADAGDPERPAHRSAAEPGRGHGPQFEVDGSAGVSSIARGNARSVRRLAVIRDASACILPFPFEALRGQAGRGSQRHENRERCDRRCSCQDPR